MKKVWFITGASKGLGLALVKKLLQEGYSVAATSRSIDQLIKAVNTGHDNNLFLPLQVDLSSEQSIEQAMAKTNQVFGKIDVIVNNAGYGIGGAIEELGNDEISESFDVNVFATIRVIKIVMPYLRQQRSGHIINISSIAGFNATTGWSIYGATKFAVVGLSEVLAEDVKEFGIHVTVVEPGAFRTSFLSTESLTLARKPMPEYTAVRAMHARYLTMDGMQAGDPDKAAVVFIKLAEDPAPPVRLFLGSDAYQRAMQKVEIIQQDLINWKEVSFSTDYTQ